MNCALDYKVTKDRKHCLGEDLSRSLAALSLVGYLHVLPRLSLPCATARLADVVLRNLTRLQTPDHDNLDDFIYRGDCIFFTGRASEAPPQTHRTEQQKTEPRHKTIIPRPPKNTSNPYRTVPSSTKKFVLLLRVRKRARATHRVKGSRVLTRFGCSRLGRRPAPCPPLPTWPARARRPSRRGAGTAQSTGTERRLGSSISALKYRGRGVASIDPHKRRGR